jgi:hypothetical protein
MVQRASQPPVWLLSQKGSIADPRRSFSFQQIAVASVSLSHRICAAPENKWRHQPLFEICGGSSYGRSNKLLIKCRRRSTGGAKTILILVYSPLNQLPQYERIKQTAVQAIAECRRRRWWSFPLANSRTAPRPWREARTILDASTLLLSDSIFQFLEKNL